MKDRDEMPCFTLRQAIEHSYYSTDVLILPHRRQYSSDRSCIQIHWQSNRESQWAFYGQSIEIHFETMTQHDVISKLFRSLFSKIDNENRYLDEFSILEALIGNKRIDQVVRDCRVGDYVLIGEVPPTSFSRWMDDYETTRAGSCTVSCVCETEEEAQRLLTVEFAQRDREYYVKRFNAWLAAGRPVKRDTYAEPPEVLPAKTVLDAITADKERRDREAQAKFAAEQKAAEEAEKQQQETTTTEGVTA